MSDARLLPSREQLTAIVEETESFLDFLRDAALIDGQKSPSIPESTIAYRKAHTAYRWFEWEKAMNPSNAPFNGPPTGIVAGGWPDWRGLHFALVDLHSTRKTLITEWGLSSVVSAKSIQFSIEALGAPGSGEKALFISAAMGPSSGCSDEVRLEKPLHWPPPLPLEWRNQCRYAVKRIKEIMQNREKLSPPPTNTSEDTASKSNCQFVNSALSALGELINACSQFQLAGAEHPTVPSVQSAPYQIVKACVDKMSHFASTRLDNLFVKHLQMKQGEWSHELIDAIRDPFRLDKNDDYEHALRVRWNHLSKLAIILENDARDVPATGAVLHATLGIVTALPHETAAVRAVFGEPPRIDVEGAGAGRAYWMADILSPLGGVHRVVIAQADMGNNVAAIRASLLLTHFPAVASVVMCGIAGGIPSTGKAEDHVQLGDIVVSSQKGVVQYDFIKRRIKKKRTEVAEEICSSPRPPSALLVEAVRILEASALLGQRPWEGFLQTGLDRLEWSRPSEATDVLVDSQDGTTVLQHPAQEIRRPGQPLVFLGPIASANTLLKDPAKRDSLREQFGVKAVEMEGSGIADATWTHGVGYLVVRAICDYCDMRKYDVWQRYAAVAAAAYIRSLLEAMPGSVASS